MAGNGYEQGRGGEPEYFTAPTHDPYRSDHPGHTRAFPAGDDGSDAYGPDGYGPGGYGPDGYGPGGYGPDAYGSDAYGPDAYGPGAAYSSDNVSTYRAGGRTTPRAGGPRLPWRALLVGIYRAPTRTFDRMRDHQVWLPALTVSLLYGVLAVLGFGGTRSEVFNSTFSVAAWSLAGAAIAFALAGLMLGAVTFALARQFGGDGPWPASVGLAVLVGWTTDAPRLLLALFLPSGNLVVQAVGWATWAFCAVLLTTMVRRVHDLPWGKAAGAAALQLLALLVLIKLPTLG